MLDGLLMAWILSLFNFDNISVSKLYKNYLIQLFQHQLITLYLL